jgi:hypothetical protein
MLAVRLFGRLPVLSTSIKRTKCLGLFAGITSGGGALMLAWKHYHVHASSSSSSSSPIPNQRVLLPIDEKKVTLSHDKFDWQLFWYYLRPQIWIIACATAVGHRPYNT